MAALTPCSTAPSSEWGITPALAVSACRCRTKQVEDAAEQQHGAGAAALDYVSATSALSLQLTEDIADVEHLLSQEEQQSVPAPRGGDREGQLSCARSAARPRSGVGRLGRESAQCSRLQARLDGAELRARGQAQTIRSLEAQLRAKDDAFAAMQQALQVLPLCAAAVVCGRRALPERARLPFATQRETVMTSPRIPTSYRWCRSCRRSKQR